MKISEFREFVKEMFIDLISSDGEVREIVLEFVKENSSVLVEGSQKQEVKKEPANPELYDRLMLVASGKEQKLMHEGKTIKTPNYGNGFKSGKHIKEWATNAYSKIGGEWTSSTNSMLDSSGVRGDTLSFLSAMGSGEGSIRSIATSGNDSLIRESIIKSGSGKMMALDENGQFDPSRSIDISELLLDTAKNELQNFPNSHDVAGPSSLGGPKEAFKGTPEEVFGESAGNWAALAFQEMGPGK